MKTLVYRTLTLALFAVITRGADNDVMRVQSPYVVKYPLGPSMEVQRHQTAGQSSSFRDPRNTNIPQYNRECFSCLPSSFSSSNYGSSGSSYNSGSSYRSGSFPASGSYVAPQSTSTRHEVRREQKFINGQPTYDLHHERRYQDGSLVHEERDEKDEDDFGVPRGPAVAAGNQISNGNNQWYHQPSSSKSWEESAYENYTHDNRHGGEYGTGNQFSSNFNEDVARLREQLHRQMGTHTSHILPSATGSSQRREYHTQTRYVNGQPVYEKKEERKYQDGRLVHNDTQEKGTDELGTADLANGYHSAGAFIPSGYYNQRQEYHEESTRVGSSQYPSSAYYSGHQRAGWDGSQTQFRGQSSESSSSVSSPRQSTSPNYGPVSSSSSEISQEHRTYSSIPSYSSSYDRTSTDTRYRNADQSSYPTYREGPYQSSTYSQNSAGRPSLYPSYRPSTSTSTSNSREESYTRSSSSQSSRPTQESSSTQLTQDTRHRASSYPSYNPSSTSGGYYSQNSGDSSSSYSPHRQTPLSSSQDHRTDAIESPSSYPSYSPVIRGTTRISQESHENAYASSSNSPSNRKTAGGYTRSYPSNRPSDDIHRSYSRERHASSSSSTQRNLINGQDASSSEDLEETRVLQNAYDKSQGNVATYTTEVNSNNLYEESERDYDQYYRQPRPNNPRSSSTRISQSTSESRYRGQDSGNNGQPLPGSHTEGGARTVAVDLSSSYSGSSLTDQLLGSSRIHHGLDSHHTANQEVSLSGRERDHQSRPFDQQSNIRQQFNQRDLSPVGIPGVISGPHSTHGDGNYDSKDRYDISPLDDNSPQLPVVGNEVDSSLIPTMPTVEGEIDSSMLLPIQPSDNDHQYSGNGDESKEIDNDINTSDSLEPRSHSTSEHTQASSHYNETHSIYGSPERQYSSGSDHIYDQSRETTSDETRRGYPGSAGSRRYHYNETRRHSTIYGGQQNPNLALSPGASTLTSDCTQISGCNAGSVTSSSRRSEIRTSKRYINGQLVGITHYERQYENGKLVHENVTEQGVDELSPYELQKYGIDTLNLERGSYEPESYSQRHEVRQEKKYVNGHQVYDLHHERQFEDGQLVHDNRTEKDEDDFGEPPSHADYPGIGYSTRFSDDTNRHEVTQSQHLQQHVRSETQPGSVGRSSQTNQVMDTSRVITKPVYTTRRHETRRQQEYVNGHPVYDLHHERRYHDGSLVFENKTELDEKNLGGSAGGHYDALHQIMSGNTLNTASESSYRQTSGASTGGSAFSASSYGSSSSRQNEGSYQGPSASQSGSSYQGSSASQSDSSYQGSSPRHGSGSSQESYRSSSSETTQNYGSLGPISDSLLTSGGPSLSHSGGARTTILGGSYQGSSSSLGSNSDQRSSETRGSESYQQSSLSSRERTQSNGSSGSTGSSFLGSGGSSLIHSGGAKTTVLGSLDTDQSNGESSSRQYSSNSFETSHQSSSAGGGCLTCVLLGGSGYSSHGSSASHGASHSYSGALGGAGYSDGYSQRREMNKEEYYEDGKLLHGQEEERSYEDGRLIQENRRQYSDIPGQYSNTKALQSAGTSYTSSGSSGSSQSSVFSSSTEGESEYGARVTVKGDTTGVCDASPCQNGGTCIAGFRGPLCVCRFGFKGTHCEEVYCPKRFCRHGGECSVEDGRHICSCRNGFSGARCQARSRRHASKP
ncbi:hypothetical protein SK128_017360 [Halocaridina rubra]|uniref:EGF-like domain-containing protein n=1 Tax=Halocaridina rubra TaxID=373956 RepID=A0AAN8WYY9_HALRR